jgi:hypothetical protein
VGRFTEADPTGVLVGWVRQIGRQVNDPDRIPTSVIEAYRTAH